MRTVTKFPPFAKKTASPKRDRLLIPKIYSIINAITNSKPAANVINP